MRLRNNTLAATLVAGLMATPLIAFGQTSTAPVPGSSTSTTTVNPGSTTPRVVGPTATTTTTTTTAVAGTPTNRASRIIGAKVRNERNETVGEVEDLILNAAGEAPTAILSVGGFLGLGARLVAVPLSDLRFDAAGEHWTLNGATRESLQQRPAYSYSNRT